MTITNPQLEQLLGYADEHAHNPLFVKAILTLAVEYENLKQKEGKRKADRWLKQKAKEFDDKFTSGEFEEVKA